MNSLNIHPLSNFFSSNKYFNKEKVPLKNILYSNQLNVPNINNQKKLKSNLLENCIQKDRKIFNNKFIKKKIKSKLNEKCNYVKKHSVSQSNFLNYRSSTTNYCLKNFPNFNNTNKNSKEFKSSMYNINKKITKNFTCCGIFQRNKLRKKMILSVANPNSINMSSFNNDFIETTSQNNLINNIPNKLADVTTNTDKKQKSIFFNKSTNFNKNKNYTQNNSNNNSSNKYNKINNSNKRTYIHQFRKRKYNNSQNNIIFNNNTSNINTKLENYFYTNYLFNDYSENNNNNNTDKNTKLIFKSTTLNNSQNSKFFKKHKLASSSNSPNKILHRSTKNSSLKKYMNKLTNTDDVKVNSTSELINNKLTKDINSLENKLNKKLNEQIMMSDNYIKYKLYKNFFAKFLRLLNEPFFPNIFFNIKNFLEVFYNGYNELMISLFSENKIIKEKNKKLLEKQLANEAENLNLRKIIKEKQKKMDLIQKKFNNLIIKRNLFKKNINNAANDNSKKNFNNNNIKIKKPNICDIKDIQNKKIYEINKENLNDLEALYFFDKIKMGNKKETSVPMLNINKNKKNKKIKPKDKFNLIKQRFESDSDEDDEIDDNEIFLIESG